MNILYTLDLIGTTAFAASGAWAGVRRDMDLLGVLALGLATATGGGILRDILLGDFPLFCFKDSTYLFLAGAVALMVFFWHRRIGLLRHPLRYFDAIGLGTFMVIGTSKGLGFNMGFLSSLIMGGNDRRRWWVARDVLSNQVPLILRKETYVSACLIGGTLLVLLHQLGVPQDLAATVAALTVIIIRLLAISPPKKNGPGDNPREGKPIRLLLPRIRPMC